MRRPHILEGPGRMLLASFVLGLVVWLLTSSLLGFGLIFVSPAAVTWLLRRR
jgi:hypothetical protein